MLWKLDCLTIKYKPQREIDLITPCILLKIHIQFKVYFDSHMLNLQLYQYLLYSKDFNQERALPNQQSFWYNQSNLDFRSSFFGNLWIEWRKLLQFSLLYFDAFDRLAQNILWNSLFTPSPCIFELIKFSLVYISIVSVLILIVILRESKKTSHTPFLLSFASPSIESNFISWRSSSLFEGYQLFHRFF